MITTDSDLQGRVLSELKWEPSIDSAEIGVTADDHVVTLRGNVATYTQKVAAARAARRVFGVQGVANEIMVAPTGTHGGSDSDIADAAVHALRWSAVVPNGAAKVTVSNGFVTLDGSVEWQFERRAAELAVRDIRGVVGVSNLIKLAPRASAKDVKVKIDGAFQRNAVIDARRIVVEEAGGKIVLRGTVHSLAERAEAEHAAWAAPGVSHVDNRLAVSA